MSIDLNYRSALWSREEAAPEFRFLAGAADFLFCTVSEAQIVAQGDDPVSLARQLAEYGAGSMAQAMWWSNRAQMALSHGEMANPASSNRYQ